jgi:hypothetical protein
VSSSRTAIRWSNANAFQAEPPARTERGGDALERAPAVSPGRHVQQRPERAVDQRRRRGKGEIAHVGFVQVKPHARGSRTGPRLAQHGG